MAAPARIADAEHRPPANVHAAETRHGQGARLARGDRHLAAAGDARYLDRASRRLDPRALADRYRAADQPKRSRHGAEPAAVDRNRRRPRIQKPEGRRRRRAQPAAAGMGYLQSPAMSEFEVIGGRGVKAARDIDRRTRPEDDAGGIDQIKIGAGSDTAVDRRRAAAGDPGDDVLDRRRGREGSALTRRHAEADKAVEQIAAELFAEAGADQIIGPG